MVYLLNISDALALFIRTHARSFSLNSFRIMKFISTTCIIPQRPLLLFHPSIFFIFRAENLCAPPFPRRICLIYFIERDSVCHWDNLHAS